MKNIIFNLLILSILFLFSCDIGKSAAYKTKDFPILKNIVNKIFTKGEVPTNFDYNPLVYDINSGYNYLITHLNNIDNKATELTITNTNKKDYYFKIIASKEDIGKVYYLDTRFFTKKADYGSYILINLTFDKNNPNDNYTVFSTTKYKTVVQEIFKGWYKLVKIKNINGYDAPKLLKL